MKKTESLESALVITAGFLVLYLVFDSQWMIWLATGVSLISVFSTKIRNLIHHSWMKLAFLLGWINSRILLSIVFYIILFPLALIQKIFVGDKLQKSKKGEKEKSYYLERNHTYSAKDLENTW